MELPIANNMNQPPPPSPATSKKQTFDVESACLHISSLYGSHQASKSFFAPAQSLKFLWTFVKVVQNWVRLAESFILFYLTLGWLSEKLSF